jgi:hypothetical protein
MATASLGDWEFRVNPDEVSWNFNVRTQSTATIGGKVIQVLGVDVSDMTVSGSFGKGGRVEQQRFLEWVLARARAQTEQDKAIVRFRLPDKGWDFGVKIKSLTEGSSRSSVDLTTSSVNPSFTLTLHVEDDLQNITELKRAAQAAYVANLSQGVGWRRTAYNGPLTTEEVLQLKGGPLGLVTFLGR